MMLAEEAAAYINEAYKQQKLHKVDYADYEA